MRKKEEKRQSSILFKVPLRIFTYSLIVGIFAFFLVNRFLNNNFKREIRENAITLSSTIDWAIAPLVEKKDIESIKRLFEKTIANSMVSQIRIYNKDCTIIYSSSDEEIGTTLQKDFVKDIVLRGKLIQKRENFNGGTYEIAIPIKERNLVVSSGGKDTFVLYLVMDFEHEKFFHLRLNLIIVGIFVFLLITLCTLIHSFIKKELLIPILRMRIGLHEVAKGKYDKKLYLNKGREINDMVRGYNFMIDRVRESSESLKANKREAERLNVLKSAFLANMTHELRTPLNSIIGYSELLLEDEEEKGPRVERLSAVVEAGKHLLSIINNILDFSKMDAEKLVLSKGTFDLKKTLKNIEELFMIHSLKTGVDFRIDIIGSIPDYYEGDEGRIRQILINLISNAFKFTYKGHILVNIRYRIGRLYVEVEDTGIGIDDEHLSKIFNSFEQVDVHHQGTGLGLAITRALCKLMDGDIDVTSQVDKGTTFSFDIALPAVEKPIEEKTYDMSILDDIMAEEEKEGEERFTILVAEDVKDNQLVLKMMLKKLKVDIDFADNGREALELFRKNRYDLFLLDIQMPVMNGFEVLAEMKAKGELEKINLVALTAYAMKDERERILEAGAHGILTKPINKEYLRTLVNNCMKRRRK